MQNEVQKVEVRKYVRSIITRSTDGPLEIDERQTLTLECEASGFPTPKVAWYLKRDDSDEETYVDR